MEKRKQLIFLEDSKGIVKTKNKNGHLYVLSDDEIKEGDWCYDLKNNCILQAKSSYEGMRIKKIIATTDTTLGLPQPSRQFIEKYIEEYNRGNIITDVLIEYELISNEEYFGNTVNPDNDVPYFDEKLKINPKDNTITIKKVKDSWNRGEVIILLKKVLAESKEQYSLLDRVGINKWIEENL